MNRTKRPRILLADDHRMMVDGLRNLLEPAYEIVGVVCSGRAMIAAAKQERPDVIVADITMPDLNGLDALEAMKRDDPQVKVVFLTMHQEIAYARRALELGASGFVLKHSAPAELVEAIQAALAGKVHLPPGMVDDVQREVQRHRRAGGDPVTSLTPRQREVLQLFAEGRAAKEIAGILGISVRTVEFHKYQLMENLGLHNSTELTHFAIKHGIVTI